MKGVVFYSGTGERIELSSKTPFGNPASGEGSERSWLTTSGLGLEILDIIGYAFHAMNHTKIRTFMGQCGHTDAHWHGNSVRIVFLPDLNGQLPPHWQGRNPREIMQHWMNYRNLLYGAGIRGGRVNVGLHFEGHTTRVNRYFTFMASYRPIEHVYYNDDTVFMRLVEPPEFFCMYEIQRYKGYEFCTIPLNYDSVLEISVRILQASNNDPAIKKFLENNFLWPRHWKKIMHYNHCEEFSHILWK